MKHLYLFVLLIFASATALSQSIIYTAAGNGLDVYAGDGGLATSGSLNDPLGVAADDAGNFYISDRDNSVIRKVDANGIITTVAGTGIPGSLGDGGQATSAQLNWPVDVILDQPNNLLYICEYMGHRIRKLNLTTGIITTVAGMGVGGFIGDGGQAINAQIFFPTEIGLDSQNNLYITDQANDRIRKVDLTTGTITTFAGNGVQANSGNGGPATSAAINHPYGIAVDPWNNVYFSSYSDNTIRRIDAVTGNIDAFAGSGMSSSFGDGGPATLAGFAFIEGICTDSVGNIYVAELSGARIRKIDAGTNTINTIAGYGNSNYSGDGGDPLLAGFWPASIEVHKGKIYISDLNHRIRVIKSADPVFYVTPTSQSTIFCFGDSTGAVTVSGMNGTEPYQYKIGTGPYQNSGTFTGLPAGTYTITARDFNGVLATVTVTITQLPPPVVSTIPNGTFNLCSTDSIYVYVQNNGVSNACEWSNGGLGSSIYLSAPGVYNVTCYDGFGCPATSPDIIITNSGQPVANFTYNQIDNYHVNFTSTSTNATTFDWSFSTGDTSTDQNPTGINYLVEGTYGATLIVTNSCGTDTITLPVIVDKLSGINENTTLSSFSLYPNPAAETAVINLASAQPIKGQLRVISAQGQLVFKENISFNSAYTKTLNLAGLAQGIYMVSVVSDKVNLSRKLVVE